MQDILKIVKSLEDSGILLNGITEIIKKKVKEQKGGFLWVTPHPLTNFEI